MADAMKKAWQDIQKSGVDGARATVKATDTISKAFTSLRGTVSGLGGMLTKVLGPISFIYLAKECMELGSAVTEVQNVVDTAFGSMAYKMEAFADSSIKNFGMSELAAKKTGSTYMAMAKSIGIVTKDASDMAVTLTGLTGDVASFFNISQDVASTRLKAVFTGETEAIKELGVVMTQTNLEQYALSKGINKSISAMTQAELVTLRYHFVLDSLNMTSGDFVKTQGSWANQTRILTEQIKALGANIGTIMTTVLLPAVRVLNDVLESLVSVTSLISAAVSSIFGVQISQNSAIAGSAADAAEAENDLAAGITNAAKAAKKSLAGFDELNILQSPDSGKDSAGAGTGAGSISDISGGTVAVSSEVQDDISPKIQALIDKIKGFGAEIKTAFMPSISAWSKAFSGLGPSIESAGSRIGTAWTTLKDTALVPFGKYITTDFIPSIVNDFSTTFAPIFADVMSVAMDIWTTDFENSCLLIQEYCGILQLAYDGVKTSFSDMCESISTNWDTYGGDLLKGFEDFKNGLWDTWWYIYDNIIDPVIAACSQTLTWLWEDHLNPLWDDIVEFVMSVGENVLALWNGFLKPLIGWIVSYLAPILTQKVNGIVQMVSLAVAVFSDVIGAILTILDGLIQFIVGVFTLDWERAWGGIKKVFEGLWNGLSGIVKGVVNSLIRIINKLVSSIYTGISSVVNGLGGVISAAGKILGQKWGFSIPIKPPQIPYLAQGAVLPPNKPFMAVVGDQKHGTNVEAPLATIQEAVRAELNDTTNAIVTAAEAVIKRQERILTAIEAIEIGDDTIGRAVERYKRKMSVVYG